MMQIKKALEKISGDLVRNEDVLCWLKEISQKYILTICLGSGTQINEVFRANGYTIKFGEQGRVCETLEQSLLAYEIQKKNKKTFEDLLIAEGINAIVEIPVVIENGIIRHINGDDYIRYAKGYDRKDVLTLKNREEDKKEQFKDYPEIKIKGF
jgi:hypothetical protein